MDGLLGLLAGVLAQATAPALTPEQAQTMPTAQLARVVLGEAGATVVRVERPIWHDCAGFCPTLTEEEVERRKGPPPLSDGLLFFQRPTAVLSAQSSWSGLCSSTVIGVGYDEDGKVTGVRTDERYGVPERMTPPDAEAASDYGARREALNRGCAERWSTEGGFLADGENTAYRAAAATALFERQAPRARQHGIQVKCLSSGGICGTPEQNEEIAALIAPARISMARQVSCTGDHKPVVLVGPDACYHLDLAQPGESAFLEIADAYGDIKLRRVEYSQLQMVY